MQLTEEKYRQFETEETLKLIQQRFKEANEWLEEQTEKTDTKEFEDQLHNLRNITSELFYKYHEYMVRPQDLRCIYFLRLFCFMFILLLILLD
ncbi:unnamed protein product [Soboliphyme baturini]|uniref:Oligoendopeptidase F n=1 Tax=Soboliphyme baturini TaxID=241478 RepID=A0A183I9Q8_9BILA|nr:unnamed protein product [Soboliphyme baturini]